MNDSDILLWAAVLVWLMLCVAIIIFECTRELGRRLIRKELKLFSSNPSPGGPPTAYTTWHSYFEARRTREGGDIWEDKDWDTYAE